MSSTSTETRTKQKAKAQAAVEARRAFLAEKGIDEKAAVKDPILRNLKARLKKANRQLTAIEARDAHVKEVSAKVAAEKQKPKDKKAKGGAGGKGGKKAAPGPPKQQATKPAKKK